MTQESNIRISRRDILFKVFIIIQILSVNLLLFGMNEHINTKVFLALVFNSIIILMASFRWLSQISIQDDTLISKNFWKKRTHYLNEIISISYLNYSSSWYLAKRIPVRIKFEKNVQVRFFPTKDGINILLNKIDDLNHPIINELDN